MSATFRSFLSFVLYLSRVILSVGVLVPVVGCMHYLVVATVLGLCIVL